MKEKEIVSISVDNHVYKLLVACVGWDLNAPLNRCLNVLLLLYNSAYICNIIQLK